MDRSRLWSVITSGLRTLRYYGDMYYNNSAWIDQHQDVEGDAPCFPDYSPCKDVRKVVCSKQPPVKLSGGSYKSEAYYHSLKPESRG